jgi:hypothetical protein
VDLYRLGREFRSTSDCKEWSLKCKEAEVRRLINLTITALVAFAAVSGVAAAQPFELQNHVSPDARDSAGQLNSRQTDLRSPDAREMSTGPVETYTPGHVTQSSPVVSVATGGFDWADAGIGAAGALALMALASGTLMIVSHRRRGRGYPIATR